MENNIDIKKMYYNNFKTKNNDKIYEQQTCPICGGHFTYYNKSKHTKSKKCQQISEIIKNHEIEKKN